MVTLATFLHDFDSGSAYFGLFCIAVIVSLGFFPMTIDIIVISAGLLCAAGALDLHWALPCVACAVLTGESIVFTSGHRLGPRVYQSRRVQQILPPQRREALVSFVRRHRWKTLWLLRVTPVYKATLLFLAAGLALNADDYRRHYTPITLAYVIAYMAVACAVGRHFEIDVRAIPYAIFGLMTAALLTGRLLGRRLGLAGDRSPQR